jgi:hypothetical protein
MWCDLIGRPPTTQKATRSTTHKIMQIESRVRAATTMSARAREYGCATPWLHDTDTLGWVLGEASAMVARQGGVGRK